MKRHERMKNIGSLSASISFFLFFFAYPKDTAFLIQFTQERAGDKVWQIQAASYYYAIWLHASIHATIQYAAIKQMRY